MEIKSRVSSAIQQNVTTETTEPKPANAAVNPSLQTGVGSTRDSFEVSVTDAGRVPSSSKLDFVKQQMTNFISSNSPADSMITVMQEYLKASVKETREDKKMAGAANDLELASKQAKLTQDSEIIQNGARESRDMYQAIDSEATYEFMIGQSSQLIKGDTQKDVDTMQHQLDVLKESASSIREKILEKTGNDQDKNKVNSNYGMLVSWLSARDDDD